MIPASSNARRFCSEIRKASDAQDATRVQQPAHSDCVRARRKRGLAQEIRDRNFPDCIRRNCAARLPGSITDESILIEVRGHKRTASRSSRASADCAFHLPDRLFRFCRSRPNQLGRARSLCVYRPEVPRRFRCRDCDCLLRNRRLFAQSLAAFPNRAC